MADKKVPEINASSMADIAFLLLIFFLVTTTMDVDSGIIRRLPPMPDPTVKPPDVKTRNMFKVSVNSKDGLFVDGKIGSIETLKEQAKRFLSNVNNDEHLPEKREENIPGLGTYDVSKGVISLKNDRGTSYNMYILVQNELTAAINELRDELSRERFGSPFIELKEDKKDAIQKAIPMSISEAEPENIGGK